MTATPQHEIDYDLAYDDGHKAAEERFAPLIEAARAYRDAKVEFVNDMTIDKRVILMTAESHLMTAITELEAARAFEVSHRRGRQRRGVIPAMTL